MLIRREDLRLVLTAGLTNALGFLAPLGFGYYATLAVLAVGDRHLWQLPPARPAAAAGDPAGGGDAGAHQELPGKPSPGARAGAVPGADARPGEWLGLRVGYKVGRARAGDGLAGPRRRSRLVDPPAHLLDLRGNPAGRAEPAAVLAQPGRDPGPQPVAWAAWIPGGGAQAGGGGAAPRDGVPRRAPRTERAAAGGPAPPAGNAAAQPPPRGGRAGRSPQPPSPPGPLLPAGGGLLDPDRSPRHARAPAGLPLPRWPPWRPSGTRRPTSSGPPPSSWRHGAAPSCLPETGSNPHRRSRSRRAGAWRTAGCGIPASRAWSSAGCSGSRAGWWPASRCSPACGAPRAAGGSWRREAAPPLARPGGPAAADRTGPRGAAAATIRGGPVLGQPAGVARAADWLELELEIQAEPMANPVGGRPRGRAGSRTRR